MNPKICVSHFRWHYIQDWSCRRKPNSRRLLPPPAPPPPSECILTQTNSIQPSREMGWTPLPSFSRCPFRCEPLLDVLEQEKWLAVLQRTGVTVDRHTFFTSTFLPIAFGRTKIQSEVNHWEQTSSPCDFPHSVREQIERWQIPGGEKVLLLCFSLRFSAFKVKLDETNVAVPQHGSLVKSFRSLSLRRQF